MAARTWLEHDNARACMDFPVEPARGRIHRRRSSGPAAPASFYEYLTTARKSRPHRRGTMASSPVVPTFQKAAHCVDEQPSSLFA